MIAEALEKNPSMKLTEFYASRDRLEQEGLEALSKVFSKQKCLEKIEVYQNGSKEGLKFLLASFVDCKGTLKSVNIQDNKSINKAIPELANFIKECTNVEYLNISDLKMTKANCLIIQQAIIDAIGPSLKLKELEWNYDLAVSTSTAQTFLSGLAEQLQGSTCLQKLSLIGVFQLKSNRDDVKKLFNTVELVLFKPEFTDDESEDHDNSEEESQQDVEEEEN